MPCFGCCTTPLENRDRNSGPNARTRRGCTDVFALIIFLLYWAGMIVLSSYVIVHGDIYRLIYGADSFGNTCGRKNTDKNVTNSGMDLTNKRHMFAMDIRDPFESVWICVERCPGETLLTMGQVADYSALHNVQYCNYNVAISEYRLPDSVRHPQSNVGPCPVTPVLSSTPVLNRCVPSVLSELSISVVRKLFGYLNNVNFVEQVVADVVSSYQKIIILCVVALVIALIVVFTIRFLAGLMIYVIFSLVSLAFIALWYGFLTLKQRLDIAQQQNGSLRAAMLVSETNNEHALLLYAVVASIITVAVLVAVCCMWSSARVLVDLFAEAGSALQAMPCLLFTPFYTAVALCILIVYWCGIAMLLATSAKATPQLKYSNSSIYTPIGFFVITFNSSVPSKYMWWYHIVGGIWTAEFILAAQQMIVAGSVATWYFARDKRNVRYPICSSLKNLILYHTGSIALGSFIITLVKLPRLILMYLHEKLRASKNPCAMYLAKCCICILYCVEKCLRYLHHNAYTIIAIEGRSFCPAAQQAVGILASQAVHVAAINTVGDFVLFLGKLGTTALTGVVAFFMLKDDPSLHFYAVPLLLSCIFAYFISHCFFSVYEMTIDTLFLCYNEDVDLHAASEVEMLAEPGLKTFMTNSLNRNRRRVSDDGVAEAETTDF